MELLLNKISTPLTISLFGFMYYKITIFESQVYDLTLKVNELTAANETLLQIVNSQQEYIKAIGPVINIFGYPIPVDVISNALILSAGLILIYFGLPNQQSIDHVIKEQVYLASKTNIDLSTRIAQDNVDALEKFFQLQSTLVTELARGVAQNVHIDNTIILERMQLLSESLCALNHSIIKKSTDTVTDTVTDMVVSTAVSNPAVIEGVSRFGTPFVELLGLST